MPMVSPERDSHPEYVVVPLSFVQIAKSAGAVMDALLERDVTVQQWCGGPQVLKNLTAATVFPLYYHFATSGYGIFDGSRPVGWLYLRGWRQVLYVETLAVAPEWRTRGVGAALLRFAETQARELRREWLGLTVTLTNDSAIRLYESQGYGRGHWRVLRRQGEPLTFPPAAGKVTLRPLVGWAASRTYRHFAARDLAAGDPETWEVQSRFLVREPHRGWLGRHWAVLIQGQPIGYVHRYGPTSGPAIYLAVDQAWWGSPHLLEAIRFALRPSEQQMAALELRLGSSGHHDAAHHVLASYGFAEHPAATMKMFKRVPLE
jgi:GNAT superfamily N-acetyltransferase